jgi:Rieske Fe-S protein
VTTDGLSRRHALVGAAAIGAGLPLLSACSSDDPATTDGAATNGAGITDGTLGAVADIPEGSGVIFPEAKVVVTQPVAGDVKAFSAVCTHQGCIVSDVTDTINCACHLSKFSLEDGSVVDGPAPSPLPEVAVTVDSGEISLA